MEHQLSDEIQSTQEKLFTTVIKRPNRPVQPLTCFSEVERQVSARVSRLFEFWNALNGLLERYEEVLRKRWGKKSASQRRAILLKAWPNMAPTHRPGFEALKYETTQQARDCSLFRDSFLIPLINLEDLMRIKTLLLLFNARGRHMPDIFATADFQGAYVGLASRAIIPDYLDGYTMLLSGQKSISTYGQLLSWKENKSAFDLMRSGAGMQPGEGLLVLEVQLKLLRFLLRVAKLILHDLPLCDMSVPIQPPPPALSSGNGEEWTSIAARSLEAPYRVPDPLDLGRMQSLVYAKRAQAKDHVLSLREDPVYFSDMVWAWGEHRQENILSVDMKSHPVRRLPLFWDRVLGGVLVDAYCNMVTWDLIWRQITQLKELKDRSATELLSSLPEDFEIAVAHFSYLLQRTSSVCMAHLRMGIPASPPLRRHYARGIQDHFSSPLIISSKTRIRNDYLLWLLENLLDQERTRICGLHCLLDELERFVQNDANERERISSWVADILSDLAIVGELQRQLSLRRPGTYVPVEECELKAKLAKETIPIVKIHDAFEAYSKLADVYAPLQRVNYPSDQKRTAATTEQMRKVDKDLLFFWQKADAHVLKQTWETVQAILPDLGLRVLGRTPIRIGPSPAARDERIDVAAGAGSFSTADLEKSAERTLTLPIRSETKAPKTATSNSRPNYTVHKRDYKVFSTLFRSPTEDGCPVELSWMDFTHALSSVGSVEKLDGSGWIFRLTHEVPEHSILFHEPLPSSKIPFRMARRYGRRLKRTYGWTGETFVKAV